MANDVRVSGAILKMITYLYRIGRYGKDIAKITMELKGKQHIGNLVKIPYNMAKKVTEMVEMLLQPLLKKTYIYTKL